jgi:hypothetical protein
LISWRRVSSSSGDNRLATVAATFSFSGSECPVATSSQFVNLETKSTLFWKERNTIAAYNNHATVFKNKFRCQVDERIVHGGSIGREGLAALPMAQWRMDSMELNSSPASACSASVAFSSSCASSSASMVVTHATSVTFTDSRSGLSASPATTTINVKRHPAASAHRNTPLPSLPISLKSSQDRIHYSLLWSQSLKSHNRTNAGNRNDLPNSREATSEPGLTLEILKQGCDELQCSTQSLLLHAPNIGFFKRSTPRSPPSSSGPSVSFHCPLIYTSSLQRQQFSEITH